VSVLWKKFSGSASWSSVPAQGAGKHYQAVVAGTGDGAMFAVEVRAGSAWRYPDVLAGAPPYVALAPLP
jgi:hypothetical protein